MVTIALPDVNVLLALGMRDHVHHADASRWFFGNSVNRWATCPFTECGFVRIASNPRLLPNGGLLDSVFSTLNMLRTRTGHEFWPADLSPATEPLMHRVRGHNQITDAYLLAIAVHRNAQVVTFDRGLFAFANMAGVAANVQLLTSEG